MVRVGAEAGEGAGPMGLIPSAVRASSRLTCVQKAHWGALGRLWRLCCWPGQGVALKGLGTFSGRIGLKDVAPARGLRAGVCKTLGGRDALPIALGTSTMRKGSSNPLRNTGHSHRLSPQLIASQPWGEPTKSAIERPSRGATDIICSFYSCFLESFDHKWMLNFVKGFLCIY